MSLSSILIAVDASDDSARRERAGLSLAERFNAHPKALAFAMTPAPMIYGESYGAEAYIMAQAGLQRDAEAAIAAAKARAQRHGATLEGEVVAGIGASPAAAIAQQALYADLVVLGAPHESAPLNKRLIEGVLFDTPTPILVWPQGRDAALSATARVTIAWDARREAALAARQAEPLLIGAEQIHVAVVTHVLGFEPYGEEPGYAFSQWLSRRGLAVELHQIEAAAIAETVLAVARDSRSELIVMGGYGHSRLREALFGGVTETMLNESEIPLLLSH